MRALAALVFAFALPAAASAQPYLGSNGPRRGSVEVSGGIGWTRGYEAGSADATLTRNTIPPAGPLTLFAVEGVVPSGPAVDVRIGVYLSRHVSAEALFQYSRPILRARISSDFESAPPVDADGVITSYLVGGSVLYHFGSGHIVPFVAGGGGYLRQLHEENAELLTGTEVHGGGGVKFWLGTGTRRVGFRLDALASSRSRSVAFELKRRLVPTIGAGIVFLF